MHCTYTLTLSTYFISKILYRLLKFILTSHARSVSLMREINIQHLQNNYKCTDIWPWDLIVCFPSPGAGVWGVQEPPGSVQHRAGMSLRGREIRVLRELYTRNTRPPWVIYEKYASCVSYVQTPLCYLAGWSRHAYLCKPKTIPAWPG